MIMLDFSEVRVNATVALQNLLSLTNEGELPLGTDRLESTDSAVEHLVQGGKSALQNDLGQSVMTAYPEVDAFVAFVDNIAQVSKACI